MHSPLDLARFLAKREQTADIAPEPTTVIGARMKENQVNSNFYSIHWQCIDFHVGACKPLNSTAECSNDMQKCPDVVLEQVAVSPNKPPHSASPQIGPLEVVIVSVLAVSLMFL